MSWSGRGGEVDRQICKRELTRGVRGHASPQIFISIPLKYLEMRLNLSNSNASKLSELKERMLLLLNIYDPMFTFASNEH